MKKSHIFTTIIISIFLASCQQPLNLLSTTGGASLSEIFNTDEKIEQLESPSQLNVSQGLYPDTIKIQWSKVNGATSYVLQRAIKSKDDPNPPEDSDFETFYASSMNIIDPSFITTTSYEDKILENPKYSDTEYQYVFYYRVSAENKREGYTPSEFTDPSNINTYGKGYLLAPPINVTATAGNYKDKVEISWQQLDKNDKKYNIYRSTDEANASAVKIATVFSNKRAYTDYILEANQGVEYYYSIEAVSSNNETSTKSAVALGYALKEGAPPKVSGVKVVSGHGETKDGIKISWDNAGDNIKYTVFRTSMTDGAMVQIATDIETNEYTDKKNIKQNTIYYYSVLAFTIPTAEEILKGPVSDPSGEAYILSPPTNVSIKKENGKYFMLFDAPVGTKESRYNSDTLSAFNEYEYKIYGGNSLTDITNEITGSTFTPYTYAEGDKNISAYIVANIDNPLLYNFYQIETVSGSQSSVRSDISAPAPDSPKSLQATKAAKIPGYTDVDYTVSNAATTSEGGYGNNKFNKNQVYPVKLTWIAPQNGAAAYDIYRSTKPDSGFRKINSEPVTELSYIDENESAKAGVYYYYKVLSLNSLNQGANYSNVDSGYGALTHNQYMREYNKTIKASQKKLTLMHKSPDTAKLGKETINGSLNGTLLYDAAMDGLGAKIVMHYQDYADFFVNNDSSLGFYFKITGNTDTKASMDSSGNMSGTVVCEGMYPGTVGYGNIIIKGGNAGGGSYTITPAGFSPVEVSYLIGNE